MLAIRQFSEKLYLSLIKRRNPVRKVTGTSAERKSIKSKSNNFTRTSKMMELHMIGTGSAYPSPHRGASCTVLRHTTGSWMFDCGEGTQTKIMKSAVKPARINKIFITHLHGDHVFGLPGFLCTLGLNSSDESRKVEIYGPVGLRKMVRTSLEISQSRLGYQYVVHELELTDTLRSTLGGELPNQQFPSNDRLHSDEIQGRTITEEKDKLWHVCCDGNMKVLAAPLKHRTVCFGYVVVEDDLPGKLDPLLLKQKGVPPGPLYAKIKNGECITTPDGTVVTPYEVVGPTRPGRKVVILGDTCDSSMIAEAGRNCDCLVHEATQENELEEKAIEFGHSTPRMAGQFGRDIQAKMLVLTHFSQRYKNISENSSESSISLAKLLQQAKEAFQNDNVIVAEDFTVVNIHFAHDF